MFKSFASLLLVVSALFFPLSAHAAEQEVEYIVKYTDGVPDALAKENAEDLPDVNIAVVTADNKAEAAKIAKKLNQDDSVEYIEKPVEREVTGTTVNDPFAPQEWHLSYLNLSQFWTTGAPNKTVVVAVIDSGISASHPDLKGKIAPGGYNFLDNSQNTDDTFGHGTSVSGVIAAATNNGIGVAGVSGQFPVKILPLKVVANDGKGSSTNVIRAIDYAISQNVDIINLSLGADQPSAAEKAAVDAAAQKGILVVASSGNDNSPNYFYPASYENAVSVGSINSRGSVSDFSNHNDQVNLTAPGEEIVTLGLTGKYVKASGTSFAAPVVSGTAAVLKSMHPEWSAAEMKRWLYRTSTDKGTPGRDNWYGYGVIAPSASSAALKTEAWRKTEPISTQKVWDVKFNQNMDVKKLLPGDIIVLDEEGRQVAAALAQGTQKSIHVLPPSAGYKPGHQYEIVIRSGIEAASGKKLNSPLRIPFSVQ